MEQTQGHLGVGRFEVHHDYDVANHWISAFLYDKLIKYQKRKDVISREH